MNEQAPAVPGNGSARNVFAATGMTVSGIVHHLSSSEGKDGKMYHNLYLTTMHNPEIKVCLKKEPEQGRYQVGSLAKVSVRLHEWKKEGRSGMIVFEAEA